MADFTLDPDEEWIRCEKCHLRLRPLAKFRPDDVRLGVPSLGPLDDMSGYGLRGMAASAVLTFLSCLFSCFTESTATFLRRRKVARFKRDLLPRFSRSLVCPQCLQIHKR